MSQRKSPSDDGLFKRRATSLLLCDFQQLLAGLAAANHTGAQQAQTDQSQRARFRDRERGATVVVAGDQELLATAAVRAVRREVGHKHVGVEVSQEVEAQIQGCTSTAVLPDVVETGAATARVRAGVEQISPGARSTGEVDLTEQAGPQAVRRATEDVDVHEVGLDQAAGADQ